VAQEYHLNDDKKLAHRSLELHRIVPESVSFTPRITELARSGGSRGAKQGHLARRPQEGSPGAARSFRSTISGAIAPITSSPEHDKAGYFGA
jgi:hypothetical protein